MQVNDLEEDLNQVQAALDNANRDYRKIKKEKKKIKEEKDNLRQQVYNLQGALSDEREDVKRKSQNIKEIRADRGRILKTMDEVRDDNRRLQRKVEDLEDRLKGEEEKWIDAIQSAAPDDRIVTARNALDALESLAQRRTATSASAAEAAQQQVRALQQRIQTLNGDVIRFSTESESNRKWAAEEKSKRSSTYCTAIRALGGGRIPFKGYSMGYLKARYDTLVGAFSARFDNLERIERIARDNGIDLGHNVGTGLGQMVQHSLQGGHIGAASYNPPRNNGNNGNNNNSQYRP